MSLKWFVKFFQIKKERFRVNLHIYPDIDEGASLNFWAKYLNLPKKQFGKIQIDKRKNKSKILKGKLKYGTAHLRVLSLGKDGQSALLRRRIMKQIEIVLSQLGK